MCPSQTFLAEKGKLWKPGAVPVTKLASTCIVLPTYNEAKNIINHLDQIFDEEYKNNEQKIKVNVLVVDDNSPDGTADLVRDYMKKSSNGHKVKLLFREEKEGLGAAYIAGFKEAIKLFDPDCILEMDSDGQHNTEDIFRLLAAVESGTDFAVGSRYIAGGSVPDNWGLHRKFVSFCASTVTKYGLGLKGVKDCSGGFRAIRTEVIENIDLDDLNVKGYAFQAALLEAAISNKVTVREVPIAFNKRLDGESKMTFKDMMEGWKLIYFVRKRKAARLLHKLKILR